MSRPDDYQDEESLQTERADVVIVGSGIAGLVTGIETLEKDPSLSVTMLEKGDRTGGTSLLSGGAFYCFESLEELNERDPAGNRQLQELVVEGHREGWDWLEDHGVPLRDVSEDHSDLDDVLPECRDMVSRKPVSRRVDTEIMFEELTESFESLGGDLRLETPMKELQTDADGRVSGVLARSSSGTQIAISAACTVLATGGFIGNEGMIEQYIAEDANDLWLRGCKWCTGDGISAAEKIGAKKTKGMNNFYGHTMLTDDANFSPRDYVRSTAYYGPYAIGLDKHGERFVDESISVHETSVGKAAAKQGLARVYYVLDEHLANSSIQDTDMGANVGDMLEIQKEMGGKISSADSLDELATLLTEWGVSGERAVETILEFNDAVKSGTAGNLNPPRKENRLTLETPPYYVVEVQPSITLTLGGLDVNTDMQVLSRHGSSTTLAHGSIDQETSYRSPIEGLYAVGADVGNIGGMIIMEEVSPMTVNTVLGRRAGQNIAEVAHPE